MSEKIDLSTYVLSEDEDFMNANHRAYFRAKLNAWKNDILREARETLDHLAEESANHPDLADRASSETDRAIELRARDRQRKLIAKIDAALQRLDEGTYGYCEETGEPIGLKRLDARRSRHCRSKPRSVTNVARRSIATNSFGLQTYKNGAACPRRFSLPYWDTILKAAGIRAPQVRACDQRKCRRACGSSLPRSSLPCARRLMPGRVPVPDGRLRLPPGGLRVSEPPSEKAAGDRR